MNTIKKIGISKWESNNTTRLLFIIFMLVGIVARVWQLGVVPGGINQDEAFAGYEAYSLLNYGDRKSVV